MKVIERDSHLAALEDILAHCTEGIAGGALISGPVGVGKTELLRSFADLAAESGVQLLHATAHDSRRAVPLSLVGQLLQAAVSGGRHSITASPGEAATAIQADSVLAPEKQSMAPALDQLYAVVAELAEKGAVLIGIDDVNHADALSLRCLAHLIRRLRSLPVLVVVTENTQLMPSCSSLYAELFRQTHWRSLRLTTLSESGVHSLLRRHLDEATAEQTAAGFFAASGGNPLLVRALLEDFQAAEAPSAAPDAVPIPRFGQAVLSCLYRSDPVVRQVAPAMAVLGECASLALTAQLADVDLEVAERAARAMDATGLTHDERFRHPGVPGVLLDDLPLRQRLALHDRTARLLHQRGEPSPAIARHLLAAGRAEAPWAPAVLDEAAEHAVVDHDTELALRCLELAHRGSTDPGQRAALRLRMATLEWQRNPALAARHLEPLTAALRAKELTAHDAVTLARHLLWHGQMSEAAEAWEWARAAHRQPDGERPAVPPARLRDLELSPAALSAAPSERPAYHQEFAVPLRTEHRRPRQAATGPAPRQNGDAVGHAERVLRAMDLGQRAPWDGEPALWALLTLVHAERDDRARYWCERMTAEAERSGSPTWQALFRGVRAHLALRRGELTEALEHGRAMLSQLPPGGWGVAIGLPLGILVTAATRLGLYQEAMSHLRRPVPRTLDQSSFGLSYLGARGHYLLATGNEDAALADFVTCGELAREWGLDAPETVPWRIGAAEVLLRQGQHDQVRQILDAVVARPGHQRSRRRGAALRLLAGASGDVRRRMALLTEAFEILEESGDRYELARVLADLSRTCQLLGDPARARTVAQQAWKVAKSCRAENLRSELFSGHPARGKGSPALSDSEERVATLAAAGYTNLQIAKRLFITASTVEQHLTRVYRKLGIKQRTQLPAVLQGAGRATTVRQ